MAEILRQIYKKWKTGDLRIRIIGTLVILGLLISIRSFTACRELGFYDLTWSPGTLIAYTRANYFCTLFLCDHPLAAYAVDEEGHEKEIKSNQMGGFGLGWLLDGRHLVISAGYGFSAGQTSKCTFAVFDAIDESLNAWTKPIR